MPVSSEPPTSPANEPGRRVDTVAGSPSVQEGPSSRAPGNHSCALGGQLRAIPRRSWVHSDLMTVGEVRILTYNVRRLRDDRAAVIRVVRAARADVLCVQEAPGGPLWRTRCSELAREAGMFLLGGGRPAAGNLLAGAARIDVHGTLDLRLSRTRGQQPRGVSSALLGLGGVRFGVIGVHGGLSSSERRRHAGEIVAVADRLRAAGAVGVVVAGDLNAAPGAPEWSGLVERCQDAYAVRPAGDELTYPTAATRARIDVVLAEPPIEVMGAGVFDHPEVARASDHRPVLAVLRLPSP